MFLYKGVSHIELCLQHVGWLCHTKMWKNRQKSREREWKRTSEKKESIDIVWSNTCVTHKRSIESASRFSADDGIERCVTNWLDGKERGVDVQSFDEFCWTFVKCTHRTASLFVLTASSDSIELCFYQHFEIVEACVFIFLNVYFTFNVLFHRLYITLSKSKIPFDCLCTQTHAVRPVNEIERTETKQKFIGEMIMTFCLFWKKKVDIEMRQLPFEMKIRFHI